MVIVWIVHLSVHPCGSIHDVDDSMPSFLSPPTNPPTNGAGLDSLAALKITQVLQSFAVGSGMIVICTM